MPITLPSSVTPSSTPSHNMLNDGVDIYWFHHKPDFPSLDPDLYRDIISKAISSVEIWDPYFHADKDHRVFDTVPNNIVIRILTAKGLDGAQVNYHLDVYTEIKTLIPPSKNVSFCIGVIDKLKKKNWDFHDRFLIIDQTDVYLIGASVEYNHTSIKSCGIYKITNEITKSFIKSQFDKYWTETVKQPTSGVELLHP